LASRRLIYPSPPTGIGAPPGAPMIDLNDLLRAIRDFCSGGCNGGWQ
jgi:hypothetical protein